MEWCVAISSFHELNPKLELELELGECVTLKRGVGLSPVVESFFHPSLLLELEVSSEGAMDEH